MVFYNLTKKVSPKKIGANFLFFFVAPPRIELGTHGFSVRCSTD